MELLFLALFLVALAAAVFVVDFARSNWQSLTALGLSLFAGGVAIWLIDILADLGKFD